MGLEASLADGEEILDAVLCLLTYLCFMQQSLKALKNRICASGSELAQHLTNLHHEVTCNFN